VERGSDVRDALKRYRTILWQKNSLTNPIFGGSICGFADRAYSQVASNSRLTLAEQDLKRLPLELHHAQGKNMSEWPVCEYCIVLGTQLWTKFKIRTTVAIRVYIPTGSEQPKDGVFPAVVKPGRIKSATVDQY